MESCVASSATRLVPRRAALRQLTREAGKKWAVLPPDACATHPPDQVFGPAFRRNARWSVDPSVPDVGAPDAPWAEVSAFYDGWFGFKSWREFPHPDEEDVESAESREHRRWIERCARPARSRRSSWLKRVPGGVAMPLRVRARTWCASVLCVCRRVRECTGRFARMHVFVCVCLCACICVCLCCRGDLEVTERFAPHCSAPSRPCCPRPPPPAPQDQRQAARQGQEGGGQAAAGVCGRRLQDGPQGGGAQGGGAAGEVREPEGCIPPGFAVAFVM